MRKRHLLVASAAIVLLLIGTLVPAGGEAQSPAPHALSARLMAATPVAQASDGAGYWLVNADGKVFALGGAKLYGSMVGKRLTAPVTGIVATADNRGYWLVAADGGVFSFGNAKFSGSLGSKTFGSPVVGMASTNALNRGAGTDGANGSAGTNGTDGASGTNGTDGANGATGAVGPTGAIGVTGALGATGAFGATGAAGSTGPQGPAGLPLYFGAYSTSPQTVAVGFPILFDTATNSGFLFADGGPGVQTTVAGTFRVRFSVNAAQPNQFGVFVSGGLVPGSIFGQASGSTQTTGEVIVTLEQFQMITINNWMSFGSVTLPTQSGGTAGNVNASLSIEQLA